MRILNCFLNFSKISIENCKVIKINIGKTNIKYLGFEIDKAETKRK